MSEKQVDDSRYIESTAVPIGYEDVGVDVDTDSVVIVHSERIDIPVKWIDKQNSKDSEFEMYQMPNISGQELIDYCVRESIARQAEYDRIHGVEIKQESGESGLNQGPPP